MANIADSHIDDLLRLTVERAASDLHVTVGLPPMIRVDGEMARISRESSKPLLSGNPKSNNTKSGLKFFTIRMASPAFPACPTTSYPLAALRIDFKPSRTRG